VLDAGKRDIYRKNVDIKREPAMDVVKKDT